MLSFFYGLFQKAPRACLTTIEIRNNMNHSPLKHSNKKIKQYIHALKLAFWHNRTKLTLETWFTYYPTRLHIYILGNALKRNVLKHFKQLDITKLWDSKSWIKIIMHHFIQINHKCNFKNKISCISLHK